MFKCVWFRWDGERCETRVSEKVSESVNLLHGGDHGFLVRLARMPKAQTANEDHKGTKPKIAQSSAGSFCASIGLFAFVFLALILLYFGLVVGCRQSLSSFSYHTTSYGQ